MSDAHIPERRAFERFNLKLRIVLISGRRVFRTYCDNISMGGIMLSAPPPRDYRHPDLTVVLQSLDGSKNIITRVSFIEGETQARLYFVDMSAESQKELEQWLSRQVNLKSVA